MHATRAGEQGSSSEQRNVRLGASSWILLLRRRRRRRRSGRPVVRTLFCFSTFLSVIFASAKPFSDFVGVHLFDYLRTSFTTIQSMGWKVSTLVIRVYQNVVQKLIPHQMDQHFTSCFGHSHALQTLMVKMIMNLIILLFTMLPCYNRSLIVQRMLLKQSMDHSNWSLIGCIKALHLYQSIVHFLQEMASKRFCTRCEWSESGCHGHWRCSHSNG